MNKIILGFFLTFLSVSAFSQVIMTVNGEDIEVEEFKRMYEKSSNNPDYSKQSINNYLNTFTEYKLKLADAYAKGLDKQPTLLRQLAIYEDKLVQEELDKHMMNDLVGEVKNRLNEEICAKHILLDVRTKATPDDTLFVYNKALRLRNELANGANFNRYVQKYSADIDTKYSGGNLGCFTALQLSSYNLENEIYQLYNGQYSMPIRSKKGYHIVQVTDRRPSNGMASATQLFARANETQSQELNFEAERKIKEAYYKLSQGAEFNEVAADFLTTENSDLQVSEDEIDWFTVGTYESDFENAIFALQQNQISEPVKTSLGWHIFRLNGKKPLPSFDKIESNVRDAIMEDERYFISKVNYGEQLKTLYNYEKQHDNVNAFIREVASGIGIKGWQTPSMYDYSSPLFTIEDRAYTAQNFVNYVRDQHSLGRFYSFDYYYDTFESDKLLDYHRAHFIEKNPSQQAKLKAYKEQLLLADDFDEKNSEKQAITINSPEVKTYYNNNSSKYRENGLVTIKKYAAPLTNKKEVDKLKGFANPKKADFFTRLALKKAVPQPTDVIEIPANEATINGINFAKTGAKGTRMKNGYFEYLVTVDVEQGDILPYNAVSKQVLNDYLLKQQQKSAENNAKEKYPYPVVINKEVLQNLYR